MSQYDDARAMSEKSPSWNNWVQKDKLVYCDLENVSLETSLKFFDDRYPVWTTSLTSLA